MEYLTSIVALLQVALSLIVTTAGTPQQEEALRFANQAMQVAQQAIVAQQVAQPAPQVGTPAPAPQQESPQPQIQPQPPMYTIKIKNDDVLIRKYAAYDWHALDSVNIPDSERPEGFKFPTDENVLKLEILVLNAEGKEVRDAVLTITATDETQNQTSKGTGAMIPVYKNNAKVQVPYYAYNYKIKTPGTHTITITAEGAAYPVTIEVSNPA